MRDHVRQIGNRDAGFTLVEMAIVLVIIGFIIGAVLTGQELIRAAEVRAQISQIQKYNAAVNTFHVKYGGLPGDLANPDAANFGFIQRGTLRGEGDGNGIVEGAEEGCDPSTQPGIIEAQGETAAFWEDLSAVSLIEGSYTVKAQDGESIEVYYPPIVTLTSSPGVKDFYPLAKIGNGNYVYVWSQNGTNYYGLSAATGSACFVLSSNATLSVQAAYNIDQKTDDGLPQTGRVIAMYLNSALSDADAVWAGASDTSPTAGSPTTCYDNSSTLNATQQYSMEVNGGNGVNCALSFKFQ